MVMMHQFVPKMNVLGRTLGPKRREKKIKQAKMGQLSSVARATLRQHRRTKLGAPFSVVPGMRADLKSKNCTTQGWMGRPAFVRVLSARVE